MKYDIDDWKCEMPGYLGWDELPKSQEGGIQNYPNKIKILEQELQNRKPKRIIEIGFNAGFSACLILNNLESPYTLKTFDVCRWGVEEEALDILKKYFENITLIKGNSRNTLPKFFKDNPEFKADFSFIDGSHSKGIVESDINTIKNNTSVGGLIIIDDIHMGDVNNAWKGIKWSGFAEHDPGIDTKGRMKLMVRVR